MSIIFKNVFENITSVKHRIFALYASPYVNEFLGVLYPNKITTILFKGGGREKASYTSYNESHVKKFYIPKISKGKFGNPVLSTRADYFLYALTAIAVLPYIFFYSRIIFITPPFFDTMIVPILRLFGKKTYVVVMDSQIALSKTYEQNLIRKLYYPFSRLIEIISVKLATKVFVVSKFIENDYKKFINPNKIFYVPNGADVETISKIKPKRMFKEFTITYLGGFEMWRGLDMLIDAFREIKMQNKEVKLLLIGGGPDFEKIKEHAKGDEDILFTGYIDHDKALSYCKGSDVLVMPSRNVLASRTISSIKCFEYIACEIPSIVTDSGEHAHWVKKFDAGLIVKSNVEGIRKGILKLMRDKNLYNKIKANCKKNKWEVDYKKFKQVFVNEVLKD